MNDSKDRTIERLERLGVIVPGCPECQQVYDAPNPLSVCVPGHTPSRWCESGKRPHCTCDTCF